MNGSKTSSAGRASQFLDQLESEVQAHPAVRHPLLKHLEQIGTNQDYLRLGMHHRHLVARFTHYLELLLLRAEDTRDKLWIAKVLVDEYGGDSDGADHGTLYRRTLENLGADAVRLAAAPKSAPAERFVREHERLCGEEAWLMGLGAVGPGHEWALPGMFAQMHRGLQRLGYTDSEVLYFPCHLEQDVHHGAWLREALLRHAESERAQRLIREGALRSLAARERFWSAIEAEFVNADDTATRSAATA